MGTGASTNGIDAEKFSPDGKYADPYAGARASALCFTGMMDYWPNVDGVTWFVDAVLPRVRAIRPDATFWIVGARPTPAVRKLEQRAGVIVTAIVARAPIMASRRSREAFAASAECADVSESSS